MASKDNVRTVRIKHVLHVPASGGYAQWHRRTVQAHTLAEWINK